MRVAQAVRGRAGAARRSGPRARGRAPRAARALLAAALAAAVAGCGAIRRAEPGAGRPERPRRTILATEQDDRRVGEESAEEAIAEFGLVRDEALQAYVQRIGERVAGQVQGTRFDYRFQVIGPWTPNAFALPGGRIFVSRGLVALTNSADELATVLAHEVVHAAARHAAAQQAVASAIPFVTGWWGAAQLAAYARDQEREADDRGQRLAAAAGYDPGALADVLRSLEQEERLQFGATRLQSFLQRHPSNTERMAAAYSRGRELRVAAGLPDARERAAHLRHLDGMVVGDDPAEGVFQGSRFLHADLGFTLSFPEGWTLVNTARMVAAFPPDRDARFALEGAGRGDDPRVAAGRFLAGEARELGADVRSAQSVEIGGRPAFEVSAVMASPQGFVSTHITWVAHGGSIYRLSATAPIPRMSRYIGRARAMARSFREITPAERASIQVQRMRIVTAREGEDLGALGRRTDNAWDPAQTALMNGLLPTARLEAGQLVKIARSEPYVPRGPEARTAGPP